MACMTARYDLRCPKSKCEEVIIEHRTRPEGPDFYCRKHGFIRPLPRIEPPAESAGPDHPRARTP